jgi:hypothetical protein
MAFSVNRAYVGNGTSSAPTGDALWYDWKTFMKGSGSASDWTVIASSDGLTMNLSGDQITQAGNGAGGMANPQSWFILKEPDNGSGKPRRQILVFRPTGADSGLQYTSVRRVFYSYEGFQLTGTGIRSAAISATNPPQAYDMLPMFAPSVIGNIYTTNPMWTPKQYAESSDWATAGTDNMLLSNSTGTRYAHFYKSDAAPWTFYAFGSRYVATDPSQRLLWIFGMDKVLDNTVYTDKDDSVSFGCGGSSGTQISKTPDRRVFGNVTAGEAWTGTACYTWSRTRADSNAALLASYNKNMCIFPAYLWSVFMNRSTAAKEQIREANIANKTIYSNTEFVFPALWMTAEGNYNPGSPLDWDTNTSYPSFYKGRSSLMVIPVSLYKFGDLVSAGGQNYIALGVAQGTNAINDTSQVLLVWNGATLGTAAS